MKRWKVLLLVLGLLLATDGAVDWKFWKQVFGPGPSFGVPDKVLLIPTGAGLDQVVDSLRAHGMITDELVFRRVAERKKYSHRVKPGRYVVRTGTSLNELINKMRSGEQDPVRITFNTIHRLPELAGKVAGYLECDSVAMLRVLLDPAVAQQYGFTQEEFIGMFIPDTYEMWWTETPNDFVARMAREYKSYWNDERKAKAGAVKLDQSEVSVLASIVQAETGVRTDAPTIAGVYLNRLRIGMPLQADPTLKYALGLDTVSRVLNIDKQIESPYNTYLHAGLPPGPINLPEKTYLDAVLNATKHDYLYFCASETLDGHSNFAKTYEQHLVNARRYHRALNERRIYR
ncbi:MAG: endolytic transglycosylase MltG [Flavobacteriales bacterium]|nr:endolytic transglycosylase MltG [Flavobacteriales bacterium]